MLALLVFAAATLPSFHGSVGDARADDIQVASATSHEPITIAADACTRWKEGVYDVWHLRGN